jgi:hypothetical protein
MFADYVDDVNKADHKDGFEDSNDECLLFNIVYFIFSKFNENFLTEEKLLKSFKST